MWNTLTVTNLQWKLEFHSWVNIKKVQMTRVNYTKCEALWLPVTPKLKEMFALSFLFVETEHSLYNIKVYRKWSVFTSSQQLIWQVDTI